MATDLGRVKSAPANKHDAFVAGQLAQAEKRIRLLDLLAGLLGYAALSLAFLVGMVVGDSKLMLSPLLRQTALYLFLAGSGVYWFCVVLRPLRLRVNPYYAARQVEQLLPHAKNSIVNWVDLHEQPLPPAIRGALGQRAAKDLARVDLDRAISGRRIAALGACAALLIVAFLTSFFVLGPAPFFSLLKRTVNPFGVAGVPTRTQLTLLKPEGGDAILTVGNGIPFVVEVGGKVPKPNAADAVKLWYRHEEGDPWLERPLIQEPSREWTTMLPPGEVRNGFWYKISGGDAITPEHRVSVRAAAALTDFRATYHFRSYVARVDEIRRERELKELRGTEILLRVRTNRTLREGRLDFEGKNGKKSVPAVVDPNEPHTLHGRFLLDEDGKYRLSFTSTENEVYHDPTAYAVTALPDNPPQVELSKPGQDIRLPADGILRLEGKASDDIGVKSLVLKMQVVGGDKLRSQSYRTEERMRLADGGYPREVEYEDYVELSTVRGEDGRALALRGGMELEYWLEARDACDYPSANITESKHFRVLLTEAEKNEAKQKQDKKQAENDKKQHERKQDRKRQKEEQERQQQRQEQQARNQEEENKSKDGDKGSAGDQGQAKAGERQNNSDKKEGEKPQGDNKDGGGANEELPKDDQKTEERIKKALEKKEEQKGEGKPEKGERGDGKGNQNKPDGGEAAGTKPDGEDKGAGRQQAKDSGEGKGKDKGEKSSDPKGKEKGEPKDGDPRNQEGAGKAGEGKAKGDPQTNKAASQGKPEPKGQERDAAGEKKPAEAKKEGERKDDGKGEGKQDGSSPKEEQPSGEGEAKPSAGKDESQTEKGQSKPDAGAKARKATSKDIEDLARGLDSKDAGEREEAKRQLERIEKEAFDPKAREKAGEALDKKGESNGSADKGSPDKGKKSESGRKGEANEKPTVPGDNPGGDGGKRIEKNGNRSGGGRASESPRQSAKPRAHRAAQMQLEDFAKKVNKDILKEAGVSEEAWQKYLASKRKQVTPREQPRAETPANPQQATPLPSMGGKTIQPSASTASDTHGPDRGQPPPGYRDSFREFTRRMSREK
jgi:hypothetical protein